MSEKLNATIEVGLDGSKVQEGVAPIARTIENLSRVAKKVSKETADSVEGIGDAGASASGKIDRSTNNMINAIQRTTVAMEAGSKTSAKYFEVLASQRGISTDTLRPYLDQLKAVESAQKNVGISAAQTAAAMRSVPAQFTDIITSLQGGQKPLTVLLQQGGQLKDMFGGVGNAAKAMGTYVVGLINPLTVAGAAIAGLGYVYSQSNEQAKAFSKSVIVSGNAAGTTTEQLMASAKRINDLGISSQSLASEALNGLVSSGNVSSSVLDQAAQAAIKSQKLLGVAIEDTVKAFAELGKSPTKSIESLNEKYHFLTLEIYEQIKALEDQGKKAEAAQLAQSTYADAIINQSSKVSATLTDWERGWLRIKNATSGAFDSAMRVFDDPTAEEKIAKLFKERDKLEASQKRLAGDNSFINFGNAERVQKLLDQNKDEINAIRDKIKAKNDEAKAEEAKNKQVQAGIEWSGLVEKNLSKEAKLELEITKARNLGIAAGKSTKEIEKEISIIRANGAEKAKKAVEDQSLAWGVQKAEAKAAGQAQEKIFDDLKKSLDAYSASVQKNTKQLISGFNEQLVAENRLKDSLDDWAKGYQESADLARLELSLLGQSSVERGTAIAQYKIELDLQKQISAIEKERASNKISDAGANEAILKAQQIAADAKNLAGIKVQQEEWSKFYSDIYNGLSDSLYRGFEAGKGFFQNFWDGIKNLFKTTVLKLAVQGVMTGVFGSLAGNAGASAISSGSSSISNLSTLYSAGKTMWEGFSAAGTLGGGIAAMGNALGSSTISAFGTGMSLSSSSASAAAAAYNSAGMTSTGTALSAGSSAGAAVPIVGWILAGMAANNSLYDKGWKYNTGADSTTKAAGLLAGGLPLMGGLLQKVFGISDKTASMLTGSALLTRLFGHKEAAIQQSDFSGSFSDSGFSGTTRNVYKAAGGLFRSDKWSETKTAIGAEQTKALTETFEAIKAASAGYAGQLGLSADALNGFTKSFSVNLSITGDAAKDAEANKKILDDIISGLANDLSLALMPSLKEFAKEGETASATFARIATNLTGTNDLFAELNLKLFALNDAGIKASSAFVDIFGGLENLQTVSASYYENFFSQEERTAKALKAVGAEFDKLSLGTLPSTRAEYRKLVEDISKTGSADQLASLLKLSGAFAAVVPEAQAVAEKVEETNDALSRFTSATDAAASPLIRVSSALDEASEAAQKAASILSERNNLQDQIDAATMTSAQLLEKQRNALDESNRAKFDELQAVLDSKKASDTLAQTNNAILDQINSLLQANETVQEARARELKGVDDSTAALKRHLYALQDETKAQADLKAQQEARAATFNDLGAAAINSLNETRKSFENLASAMKQARDELLTGGQSGFSTQDRLYALKQQLDKASAAETPALANSYLQALKESGVGGLDYQREFSLLVNRIDGLSSDAKARAIDAADVSQLTPFFELLNKQRMEADLRDALNSEYSTYANELPTIAMNPSAPYIPWGNKLTAAMEGFSKGTDTPETTAKLLEEIKALRLASERTATLLHQVTAGGYAILTEPVK